MKIWIIIIMGFLILIYIINKKEEIKKAKTYIKELEAQNKISQLEEQENINLPEVKPTATPTFLHQYQNCIIEDYEKQFFLIMKPSGEKLEKTFRSLEDAKKEIDMVTPLLKKEVFTKNVRYVK